MMRTNPTPLALIALLAIAAAVTAALAGGHSIPATERPSSTPDGRKEASPRPVDTPSRDPATEVARRYALAVRNWTPASYRASWRTQIRLAAGRYRRELISARPRTAQLRALERDRAANRARVARAQRVPALRPPDARVLVTLEEITAAGGQTIDGLTLNEVRLASRHGDWRVVGWTVIPGGEER